MKVGALLFMCTFAYTSLYAQIGRMTPADHAAFLSRDVSLPTASAQASSAKVTLEVRDSSLAYIVRALTQSAGLGVVFDSRNPVFAMKKTVNIKDEVILQALQIALSGTSLRASLAPNKETIMIHSDTLTSITNNQRGSISGRVTDSANNRSVEGATVSIIGVERSAATASDGSFRINSVPKGAHTLYVRALGFQTKKVSVTVEDSKQVTIDVHLQAATTSLSEVVTTATGQQRRVEVANDIVKIDAEKIMERAPVQSFTDLIEAAHVPGVLVSRANGEPASPSRIRIRGLKTITQNKDPVVIVDGNWIDATVGTPSGIDDIDPATIETVEIIRGPSASSLYGQDAANGVIVITTRKGRPGPTRWRSSYQRNWGHTYGKMPLSYAGFGRDLASGVRARCRIIDVIDGSCIQDSVAIYDPNHPLVSREGGEFSNRFVFGVEGGSNNTTYSITGTSQRLVGVRRMKPVDMIRYRTLGLPIEAAFRVPTGENVNSISTGLTMVPTQTITLGLTLTGSQTDITNNSISQTIPTLMDADYSLDTIGLFISLDGTNRFNSSFHFIESPVQRSSILLAGRADWRPRSTWFIHANAGINRSNTKSSMFSRGVRCRGLVCADTVGERREEGRDNTDITFRTNISRQLNLGKFSRFLELHPSLGGDFRRTENSILGVTVNNIPANERSLSGGTAPVLQHNSREQAIAGWYANLRVGVLSRIYFDLGARQDIGSAMVSTMPRGMRYPKLGGSWLVSDESFWPSQSIIGSLRLRSAIGYAAIQPDPSDIWGGFENAALRYIGGQFVRAVRLNRTGNPNLLPERAMEVEIGFDADMFEERINIVANYAHTETVNSMVSRPLPPSAGALTRKENIGRVRNRNFEMVTQVKAIDSRVAKLDLSYTATLKENVVVKLGDGVFPFTNVAVGRIQEGFPIASVWVRRVIGYSDVNDDGLMAKEEVVLSDSMVYAGWSQPRYESGYGFNLSLFGKISFDTRVSHRSRYTQQYTRNNRYGTEDATAPLEIQAQEVIANISNRRSVSDIRWNSASMVFHIPPSFLSSMKVRSLNIGIKASNLGLWTNYAGRDPAVNSNLVNREVASEAGNEIPQPRRFVLDVNLGF